MLLSTPAMLQLWACLRLPGVAAIWIRALRFLISRCRLLSRPTFRMCLAPPPSMTPPADLTLPPVSRLCQPVVCNPIWMIRARLPSTPLPSRALRPGGPARCRGVLYRPAKHPGDLHNLLQPSVALQLHAYYLQLQLHLPGRNRHCEDVPPHGEPSDLQRCRRDPDVRRQRTLRLRGPLLATSCTTARRHGRRPTSARWTTTG